MKATSILVRMQKENPDTLYSVCGTYYHADEERALAFLSEVNWQLERHPEGFVGVYSEQLLSDINTICRQRDKTT